MVATGTIKFAAKAGKLAWTPPETGGSKGQKRTYIPAGKSPIQHCVLPGQKTLNLWTEEQLPFDLTVYIYQAGVVVG